MEDFLVVLFLIFYLFAAVAGRKNKEKKKRPGRGRRARTDLEAALSGRVQARRDAAARQAETDAHEQTACEQQRLHLHEVTQAQLHAAEEGEDPCHEGEAPTEAAEGFCFSEPDAQDNALAQELLRGVIASEVLTRPCERMAMKRSKRRTV